MRCLGPGGRNWPTKRWAAIAAANNITNTASLDAYLATVITGTDATTLRNEMRVVVREIVRALVEMADGEQGA